MLCATAFLTTVHRPGHQAISPWDIVQGCFKERENRDRNFQILEDFLQIQVRGDSKVNERI